jgi:hypothetical protein
MTEINQDDFKKLQDLVLYYKMEKLFEEPSSYEDDLDELEI